MALHDYRCPDCGAVKTDVYVPITIRASAAVVLCDACLYEVVEDCPPAQARMEWIPAVGRMDCSSGPAFKQFTMHERQRDGSHREITISSLAELRRIERDSERRAANGEGEAVRFRAWSQDDSNGDVNTFGKDPGTLIREQLARDQAALKDRGRRLGRLRKDQGEHVRHRELGPGVTEATVSPIAVLP